jgi:N-acetylglucosaminyldiphosphoundecaprenol N-acetyl-beta-D-mannosaminyltransferase
LGVAVDAVALAEAIECIGAWIAEAHAREGPGQVRHVVTLNPEMVMAARRDPAFQRTVLAGDLITVDGMGIMLAAAIQGVRLPGRVTGVDLLEALATRAAVTGERLFLLGAQPGVAESAAAALERRHPGLRLAGAHAGSPAPADDERALTRIRAARPDILVVAYGAPAQERWIVRNRARLGAMVAIGVGGALDYAAGQMPRAPLWLRRLGLEWLFRLVRQPWRWRRMLALPRFAVLALMEALRMHPTRGGFQ